MNERLLSEPGAKKAGALPLQVFPWILACLGLMLMLLVNASIGPVHIPIKALVNLAASRLAGAAPDPSYPASYTAILFAIRLPNAVLIALTGMALSASGAAYQGVFRNPLADPYIIGVASGAGLGAVAAMSLHWPADMLGMHLVPLAAFAGAVLTVSLVYALARVGTTTPITNLNSCRRGCECLCFCPHKLDDARKHSTASSGHRLADGGIRAWGLGAYSYRNYPTWSSG